MAEFKIERFLGKNNIPDQFNNGVTVFNDGKIGIGLYKALNIDLDNDFSMSRRNGKISILSSSGIHSLSDDAPGYFVKDSDLCKMVHINSNNTIEYEVLSSNIVVGSRYRMRYTTIDDKIYFCNGVNNGVIENGTIRPWGIELPFAPLIQIIEGGTLRIGTYRILITFTDKKGQESGAVDANKIEIINNGQALRVYNIYNSPELSIKYTNIYMTEVNGNKFYLKAKILKGDTEFIINDNKNMSSLMDTNFFMKPPVGEMSTLYNGRLYIASGKNIFYSDSYRYELFNYEWLPFESNIRMLRAVTDGIFISTNDKVIFLKGEDVSEFKYKMKARYPAVKHTDAYINGGKFEEGMNIIWTSDRGVCVGADGGEFKNVTEEFYVPPITVENGAGIFRQENGINQYISVLTNTKVNIEEKSNISITRDIRSNYN